MPGVRPQVGDIVELRHVYTCQAQIGENIVHYKVGAITGGGATLIEASSGFGFLLTTTAPPCMPSIAAYYGTSAKNLVDPATSAQSSVFNTVGTLSASVSPKQVAVVLSLTSSLAGPKNRGRNYFPFFSAGLIAANGQLSAAGLALFNTLLSNGMPLIHVIDDGAGNTTTYGKVILHPGPLTVPVDPARSTLVTFQTTQSKLGTQRRRGDYGRVNVTPF